RHDVVVVDLAPGITATRLEALLTPLPEAVVLRAFGVGNVPSQEPGLTAVVERAIASGTAVVVTSQCHESEVLLGHYEAGDALARSGAVGSRDMTLEAAYAKVQFLLSQGLRGPELAAWMGRSIAGELTQ
ncbi:L-asparaginase 1, partial [Actinomyces naeslundii]